LSTVKRQSHTERINPNAPQQSVDLDQRA
jgi:hypothetical protein